MSMVRQRLVYRMQFLSETARMKIEHIIAQDNFSR